MKWVGQNASAGDVARWAQSSQWRDGKVQSPATQHPLVDRTRGTGALNRVRTQPRWNSSHCLAPRPGNRAELAARVTPPAPTGFRAVSSGHCFTGLRTGPAHLGAALHGCIIAERFTRVGALVTTLGALTAHGTDGRRHLLHRCRALRAALDAILHRPDVICRGVSAAFVKAIRDGGFASIVAQLASFDAFLHRAVILMGRHASSPRQRQ